MLITIASHNANLILTGYIVKKNKLCEWAETNGDNLDIFTDALAVCNADSSCIGFSGRTGGTSWETCPPDSIDKYASGYTLYKKGTEIQLYPKKGVIKAVLWLYTHLIQIVLFQT